MITAPNSLMPRANIITIPLTILRHAIGTEILKNTRDGDAPRVNATFSNRSGTAANPSRAALIKNGMLTKAMAKTIPVFVPTKLIPTDDAACPNQVSLEMHPSNAIPAAVCGITIGKSITPIITCLNLNFLRARIYARGIAAIPKNNVPIIDAERVIQTLRLISGSSAALPSSPGETENANPASGAIMKRSAIPPNKTSKRLNG